MIPDDEDRNKSEAKGCWGENEETMNFTRHRQKPFKRILNNHSGSEKLSLGCWKIGWIFSPVPAESPSPRGPRIANKLPFMSSKSNRIFFTTTRKFAYDVCLPRRERRAPDCRDFYCSCSSHDNTIIMPRRVVKKTFLFVFCASAEGRAEDECLLVFLSKQARRSIIVTCFLLFEIN